VVLPAIAPLSPAVSESSAGGGSKGLVVALGIALLVGAGALVVMAGLDSDTDTRRTKSSVDRDDDDKGKKDEAKTTVSRTVTSTARKSTAEKGSSRPAETMVMPVDEEPEPEPLRSLDSSVSSFSASSTLDDFKEFKFDAYLMGDGNLKTCWQEGRANGNYGEGEYVTVNFRESVDITEVSIANGCQFHNSRLGDLWILNSRPSRLEIYSDQGHRETWSLDNVTGWQTRQVDFKGVRWLRFTIKAVRSGTEWEDTSISELSFKGRSSSY
jgi:hypothetical protein